MRALPAPRITPLRGGPVLRWGVLAPGEIARDFVTTLHANTEQRAHAVASRSAERAANFAEGTRQATAYGLAIGCETTSTAWDAVSAPGIQPRYRSVPQWYYLIMATNLRLRPEAETALRKESERTGRSQQDLIREALDRYLSIGTPRPAPSSIDELIASGALLLAREPYRRPHRRLTLPPGVTSLDLLDREDRF